MAYDYRRLDALLERLNINWKKHNMPQFPDDHITREELKAALKARTTGGGTTGQLSFGYYTPDTLTDSVVDSVQDKRPFAYRYRPDRYSAGGRSDEPYFPGEKITLAELEASFTRLHFADFTSPQHVRKLWDDIRIHREGFAVNDIVRSNTGAVFSLQASGRWKNYTDDNFVNYDVPSRPLVKIGTAK
jgi:hypothetical protein